MAQTINKIKVKNINYDIDAKFLEGKSKDDFLLTTCPNRISAKINWTLDSIFSRPVLQVDSFTKFTWPVEFLKDSTFSSFDCTEMSAFEKGAIYNFPHSNTGVNENDFYINLPHINGLIGWEQPGNSQNTKVKGWGIGSDDYNAPGEVNLGSITFNTIVPDDGGSSYSTAWDNAPIIWNFNQGTVKAANFMLQKGYGPSYNWYSALALDDTTNQITIGSEETPIMLANSTTIAGNLDLNNNSITNCSQITAGQFVTPGGPIFKSEGGNEFNIYSGDTTWINWRGGSSTIKIGNGASNGGYGKLHANGIFLNTGDATLKTYAIKWGQNPETFALQSSIDGTDGETHSYVTDTSVNYRCNIALQPRGGNVYIGTAPDNPNNNHKLTIAGKMTVMDSNKANKNKITLDYNSIESWSTDETAAQGLYFNWYKKGDVNFQNNNVIINTSNGIYPGTDNYLDLGTVAKYWKNIYAVDTHLWKHLCIGPTYFSSYNSSRAELDVITKTDDACDIWLGSNNDRKWSITARPSDEDFNLGFYSDALSIIFKRTGEIQSTGLEIKNSNSTGATSARIKYDEIDQCIKFIF